MATQKKVETVEKLSTKFKNAKSVIFADYVGIKHKQLEELRRGLKKIDAEFVVTKNKLLARALGDKAKDVAELMKQSTATLFSFQDEVAGVKELLKFFKAANMGKTKGGLLGDTVLNEKEVITLSELPGKEQLIGKLAGQLNAPIQGLHYALSWNLNKFVWALNAIKNKKS